MCLHIYFAFKNILQRANVFFLNSVNLKWQPHLLFPQKFGLKEPQTFSIVHSTSPSIDKWWLYHIKIGFNIHSVYIYKLNVSFMFNVYFSIIWKGKPKICQSKQLDFYSKGGELRRKKLQLIANNKANEHVQAKNSMERTSQKMSVCIHMRSCDSVNLQCKCAFFYLKFHLASFSALFITMFCMFMSCF